MRQSSFYSLFIFFLFGGIPNSNICIGTSSANYQRLQESTYDLIKTAIIEKKSMTFYYNGFLRKASPHVLGTKNGREQALFMQYDGYSESGLSEDLRYNWRCFFLNKIRNPSLNDDEFYTTNNHSRNQSCVDVEDVIVDY